MSEGDIIHPQLLLSCLLVESSSVSAIPLFLQLREPYGLATERMLYNSSIALGGLRSFYIHVGEISLEVHLFVPRSQSIYLAFEGMTLGKERLHHT